MHLRFCLGDPSIYSSYTINDIPIQVKSEHRDLGVIASSDLTWKCHYDHQVTRVYRTLGLLRRTFKAADSIAAKLHLYVSLIKSQLLYCSQVWRPHFIKDIVKLENVQRRATKYILNDYNSDYKSRLTSLNLLPLMLEFEISDLMFCIRSFKSPASHFNISDYFTFSSNATRSRTHMKMHHSRTTNNISLHSFFNRLPRLWNTLPPIDLSEPTALIKRKLTLVFKSHFTNNFLPSSPCSFHLLCPCNSCSRTPHSTTF